VGVLEGIEELLLTLNTMGRVQTAKPRLLFVSLFASVSIISTTKDTMLLIFALTISLLLMPYIDKIGKKAVIKLLLLSLIFSLPLLLSNPYDAINFLLRVSSSALLVFETIYLVGWPTMVKGMEGLMLPHGFSQAIMMMLIYSERWVRELMKMIAARRARTMNDNRMREIV